MKFGWFIFLALLVVGGVVGGLKLVNSGGGSVPVVGSGGESEAPPAQVEERSPTSTGLPPVPEVFENAPEEPLGLAIPRYDAAEKQALIEGLTLPMFEEVSAEVGLDFVHRSDPVLRGMRARLVVPLGIAGGGVAAGDVDGDGWDDVFLAGDDGGRLYRNMSGQRFADVTEECGLEFRGEARAPTLVDFDGDGDLDLFLTFAWSHDRLYTNDGTGIFTEITEKVGLGEHQEMSHEAVWFDIEGDGLLDLYVACFGPWPLGRSPEVGKQNLDGVQNLLYHHGLVDGEHVLVEVGSAAGVGDTGWSHSVEAWDFDEDGKVDLFSLNDFARAQIYRNQGGDRFEEWSLVLGMPETYNCMSFGVWDLDGNGQLEAYVSQISNPFSVGGKQYRYAHPEERISILPADVLMKLRRIVKNQLLFVGEEGAMEDIVGKLFEPADHGWSWDASAFDYENDGDLDFLILNGTDGDPPRLARERRGEFIDQANFVKAYASEPNLFFVNVGNYLYDISAISELAYSGNSRSSVFLDFDHDGDLDLVTNEYEGPAKFFRNLQSTGNAWIQIELEGTKSNRSALGAKIEITDSGGRRQVALVTTTTGFMSCDPLPRHFGLGQAMGLVTARILWPSGETQSVEGLEPGRRHHIRQP